MYLARDLELGVFRAVKELPISNRKEAGLLRLLEHPLLPKMIDYAERDEFCYIIMEYIRGKSLEQYLKEDYIFSIKEILDIADAILQVLEYLHSRKPAVFYGDLKPSNLMMTSQKRLYLVDFGSATFSYSAFHGEMKGTRGYAAPEQLKGSVGAPSDFYALGKTLERLCGRQKIKYLMKCPLLGKFLLKCCRVEPGKRWKNATQARNELLKIHPIQIKLKSILVSAAVVLLTLTMILHLETGRRNLPELSKSLTLVTAEYFGIQYRSGLKTLQEQTNNHIEKKLQNLLRVYQTPDEQIRILELLAGNGELADRADRAELYYRQLLTYEPEYVKGYLEYGTFLCRQRRYQESRAVYRQWKSKQTEAAMQISEEISDAWQEWEKEAGIILGKEKT